MKNFKVPEDFSVFLEQEKNSGAIDLTKIDFKTLYQYTIKYASNILYNTDFEEDLMEHIKVYIALIYGENGLNGNYFKENAERIVKSILKLPNDIVYLYNNELYVPYTTPVVINGNINAFTVIYEPIEQNEEG